MLHSVASPYAPAMPHHLGKAAAEDLVRLSGRTWTVLQPGAYLQNLDLTRTGTACRSAEFGKGCQSPGGVLAEGDGAAAVGGH